jgi:hypothetical protein
LHLFAADSPGLNALFGWVDDLQFTPQLPSTLPSKRPFSRNRSSGLTLFNRALA